MKKVHKWSLVVSVIMLMAFSAVAYAGYRGGDNLSIVPGMEDYASMPKLHGDPVLATGAFSAHSQHTLNFYGWQRRYSTLNVDSCHVTMKVKNLQDLGDNAVYEAWMVDESDGYKLSLGRFKTSQKYGTGTLSFTSSCDWATYDSLEISIEDYVDDNAGQSDLVIMEGSLN